MGLQFKMLHYYLYLWVMLKYYLTVIAVISVIAIINIKYYNYYYFGNFVIK